MLWLFVGANMDVLGQKADTISTSEQFYDSLKYKAYRHRITRLVYDNIVSKKKKNSQLKFEKESDDLNALSGKTIASVRIQQLDIIGPSFSDTSRVSQTWLGQLANNVHTQTNKRIIKKNILIHVGDSVNVEKVLENERIIRQLPFIKDVRFLVEEDSLYTNQVHVTVLTKDVFSFGIGGNINGLKAASLKMYNQNIWGIGHQISATMVGHVDKKPYVGFEGYYTVNNIGGNFVNISLGYSDTYKRHGAAFISDKEFLTSTTKWGGGVTAFRWKRADRLIDDGPVILDYNLDYRYLDFWSGYSFQLNENYSYKNSQLVFSGRVRQYRFFKRPEPDHQNNQYFANSTFFLASLSLSRRHYIRDHLIYSYGITEDIPKGFLHELIVGYDNNEFENRWYSHLYFSSGNFIKYKPAYFFASTGFGGFFNTKRFEQGLFEMDGSYISRLYQIGNKNFRQFVKMNYMIGVRRFDLENLYLSRDKGIRGFNSNMALGTQRLKVSFESVLFPPKRVLDFNFAFFSFLDLGVIGSNKEFLLNQDYYAGIGVGIRIRNENLVFRTLQLRLAFFPNHPPDMDGVGFDLSEQRKSHFYSFQPRKPDILRFE